MPKFSVDRALVKANSLARKGKIEEAQELYQTVLHVFPKNRRAQQGLAGLRSSEKIVETLGPHQNKINQLINLFNLGQLATVIDQAKALTQEHPRAFVVWNILGVANKSLRKFDDAEDAFKRVTEINPTYPDGFNNLGVALRDQGQLDEAIASYNRALSLKPDYVEAHNNLGTALREQGQLDEAIASYNKALSLKPDYVEAHNNLGTALKEQGQLDEAIASYNKALSLKPDYIEAHNNLGVALRDQGHLDEAIESYNKALSLKPDCAEAYNNKGNILKKQGHLDEAIASYNKALSLKPDYVEAYSNMGIALKEQGQLDEAIASYNKALSLKPDYVEAHNNLGTALREQGQLDEAIVSYNKALSLKPDCVEAYSNMGIALKEQGQLDEAIASYNKALSLKPDCAEAYNNMGIALKEQGQLDEAIASYNKALSLKPDYVEAHNNMGIALKEQGHLDQAIASYNKALSLKPDYVEAHNNMGIALKEQGQLDEAIASYNIALSLKPDYVEAYSNKGIALKEQGQLDEAIASYNKALSLKPDYAVAWLNGAETLEKWNQLDQLELWLEHAFEILEPVPSDIQFLKAKLLWRKNDFKDASILILNIDFEAISQNLKQDFLHLKAKYFEKSKQFDQAYKCFNLSNELAKQTINYGKCMPDTYFKNLQDQLTKIKSASVNTGKHHGAEKAEFTPVFLVGFPRSGTTLLDTILRSHSRIEVVEEKNAVDVAKTFLQNKGFKHIADKPLPAKVILEAMTIYETEFMKHVEGSFSDSVYIDKLPLNLLQIPWIQKIYPHAKFILALRHPFDTILSCWMQNFKLNAAMANMVDLHRIVEFYCLAMDTFKICRSKYDLSVHEIRYEDLLEDLSGEASRLLEFLDLDWEYKMENYQETAIKRGRINTPSYSQVVQPIYKDAKYRWLNYEKYLTEYFHEIEPWLSEFKYNDG